MKIEYYYNERWYPHLSQYGKPTFIGQQRRLKRQLIVLTHRVFREILRK